MRYIVDIDGTICDSVNSDYPNAVPYENRIKSINALFDAGHEVIYWTARGQQSGYDWTRLTFEQLDTWGVKYTTIWMGKPHYDVWIDDKAFNAREYIEFVL